MLTLEQCPLFKRLNSQELRALAALGQERAFQAGQEIFKEGDAGDGLYVVKEGQVEISVLVGSGTRHVFSQIEPGDVFGEMAVLEDKPRSASAVARCPTVVYFFAWAGMLDLVASSAALAQALLREVSERLREFNRQYLREVLQAERLAVVGRFARSIVHDLKNPLNIIGLTAEVGLSASQAEARREAATSIRQQVDRINEMIGEILDFTQGTTVELVLPPLDYAQFIQDVFKEIGPEAALKRATIELENEPPAVALLFNPKRLRRVFHNLVHNALDAMPDGGRIRLRFRRTPTEVLTEVEDTGPGIAPEIAGQLFTAFATYGKANGTGLGLSICKRILSDHHGWIEARPQPGHGAIFAFGLPVPAPVEDAQAPVNEPAFDSLKMA
jgi:signal transduction histidine kinase